MKLAGKRAWVCGASRGIGRAIAETLAADGASLTLIARDADALAALAAQLPGSGHRGLSLDLAETSVLAERISQELRRYPAPEILINNTGGPPPGPVLTAEPEAFEAALRQHLLAAQLLVQALVPGMRDAGYGRIINVISTSVRQPIPGLGVSNTIRGAMASWAKTLAGELACDGITVNSVLPGYTATERLTQLMQARADRTGSSLEAVREAYLAQVPAGRFAQPAEIAAAVGFLASPLAGYITGVALPVDGGRIQGL